MRSMWVSTVIALFAPAAFGQTGTLDQSSPYSDGGASAQYNTDADFLVWQQQIRAAVSGQLEGIRIRLTGPAEATIHLRVRRGDAWAASKVLFETLVAKTAPGFETFFVDMTAAGINLSDGETFVMETQGTNSGVWLIGNYIAPPGTPLYDEPLFLTGSVFVPGWRHGFDTFMLVGERPCVGDTDGDRDVDLQDLANLLGHFGTAAGATVSDGDTDTDGDVDLQDLANLLGNFGSQCS